jgi:hypothetical protein
VRRLHFEVFTLKIVRGNLLQNLIQCSELEFRMPQRLECLRVDQKKLRFEAEQEAVMISHCLYLVAPAL